MPGYAGHWFDDQGNRVIMLVDPSQAPLAERVIDARPQPELTEGETRTGQTNVVQAQYSFAELKGWRDRANDPVLNVPGAQGIDADEGRNRLTVWIDDEKARPGVESALRGAGVPLGGYLVEIGKIETHQTLTNFFRPLQGGYQTQNALGGICSLGPPVPAGPGAYYTASHCTQVFWANTGTNFYQHLIGAPFLVGPEASDPAGWACGWPWVCRWSDVARVNVAGGTPAANQIARTTGFAINWAIGSSNTAGVPAFNVVNPPQWWPLLNQWVDKVGRSSGWNRGQVTNTCVNVSGVVGLPANRRVMCQYFARYRSDPGDSGAPVFLQLGGLSARVTGVNWGAINAGFPPFARAIFSPSGGIAADGL